MDEENKKYTPKIKELLATYYDRNRNYKLDPGEFLAFDFDHDVNQMIASFKDPHLHHTRISIYNPTRPVFHDGKKYLIGRVEPEDSEISKIMFFEEGEGVWRLVNEAPVLGLQDPFYLSNVQGYQIIGGVRIILDPATSEITGYETVFYRYHNSVMELFDENRKVIEPFAVGPRGMKDIRLIELQNGKVAVFTRPQGGIAGLGKIGYIEIDSLDELEKKIPYAQIIPNQFHDDEWGGVNDLVLLINGMIGVIAHIAHFDGQVKHYYAMSFVFDPVAKNATHPEILTTADDFPPVKPKKTDLGKVIFSGGITRNSDGTADLYVGIGDVKAGHIKIKDPFLKYEK